MAKYRERGTARYETGPVEAESAEEAEQLLSDLQSRLGENEYSYLERFDEVLEDWYPAESFDDYDDEEDEDGENSPLDVE